MQTNSWRYDRRRNLFTIFFPPRYATRRYITCTPTVPLQRLDMDLGRIIRPQRVPLMTALCNVPARNALIVDFGSHFSRHVGSRRRR
jgi:hypothetical protein